MSSSKTVEEHVLKQDGAPDVRVEVTTDDGIWVWVGGEVLRAEKFDKLVDFVNLYLPS